MKIMKVVPGIFAVVGIVLLGFSLWSYLSNQSFLESALIAEGEVIDLARKRSSGNSSSSSSRQSSHTYAPVVRFNTADGQTVEVISGVGSNPPSHRPGDIVQIFYAPDDPYDAKIDSFMDLHFMTILLAGMGSLFFLTGGGILGFGLMRTRQAAALKRSGTRIEAKVTGVSKNTRVKSGGRSPYSIEAQWQNPRTSAIHTFSSEMIWFDPTEYLTQEKVPVLINPDNPSKYYMDISFLPKHAD